MMPHPVVARETKEAKETKAVKEEREANKLRRKKMKWKIFLPLITKKILKQPQQLSRKRPKMPRRRERNRRQSPNLSSSGRLNPGDQRPIWMYSGKRFSLR